ncbi:MAG: hypothetical protein Q7K71_03880 [Candidatus Omnitrophota bacterium]|nr:hypothetical protein [Candidatus Omnitrophota bacterium]
MTGQVRRDHSVRFIPEFIIDNGEMVAFMEFSGIGDYAFVERILYDFCDRLLSPQHFLCGRHFVLYEGVSDFAQGFILSR